MLFSLPASRKSHNVITGRGLRIKTTDVKAVIRDSDGGEMRAPFQLGSSFGAGCCHSRAYPADSVCVSRGAGGGH